MVLPIVMVEAIVDLTEEIVMVPVIDMETDMEAIDITTMDVSSLVAMLTTKQYTIYVYNYQDICKWSFFGSVHKCLIFFLQTRSVQN